jgi:trigger factor
MTAPDIEISVSQSDAASRTLNVTVPVERISAAEEETVRWYSAKVKLPGFRKGKAPAPVVRKRFADAIRQSVLEDLVRETWNKAREEQNIRPLGEPEVRILKFEQGQPLNFEIRVDVKPDIKLDRIGGFRLTRQVQPVTDEMIDVQLLQLREQRAPWVPAEGRAKPGDLVEATITNLDQEPAAEGEPVRFVLGQGRALPELEEQIMQLDPGGTWEGTVRFPEDHPDEERRGKSRRVRALLREVKRQQLPDLDDAFAREASEKFTTLEELKAAVKADLEAEAKREADARLRGELIEQLAAANNVSVPPSLLDRAIHAYMHAYGVPHEQHERFHHEFRPVAESQVRRDLIVDAVASQHNLYAKPEEVDGRVAEIAQRRGESPGAVRAALDKAGRLRELERSLTDDKVFAHLLGLSTVDEAPTAR